MRRRTGYGFFGGLLSMGAPLGLLAIRLLQQQGSSWSLRRIRGVVAADPTGFAYVSVSTALAFMSFGLVLGRQADRLADLSQIDALTGLLNARGLSERLDEEFARFTRYHEPLALLLVDLDGLKGINDRLGHRAGDVALRHVADAIRAELRATDVGARWGGDEFAILAPNTPEAAALALAERVRALIARQDVPWRLTASIGVAATTSGAHGDKRTNPATIMHVADRALYRAKRRGRYSVVVSADPSNNSIRVL
jgi:diguanylate cyclase (GGDEF)-like protein